MVAASIASSREAVGQRPDIAEERNRLLRALTPGAYAQLVSTMERVSLSTGDVLYEPDEPISDAYFIQRGVASLVAPVDQSERGWERTVEVGTIGNEGMVGLPLVLGSDREPVRAFIYTRGHITVVDRIGLESASCACYRTIRDSYDRLFG
jgi:CRP-like cAMP-binding protein